MIKTITLIGSGNVAHNLGRAFCEAGFEVIEVYSRTLSNAKELATQVDAKFTNDLSEINKRSDLYVIATTDNAIEEIASNLELKNKFVVHTSGSVSMSSLSGASSKIGCFYPLQTFTKSHQADFSEIPICVEANSKETLVEINHLANSLTNHVAELSSMQRQKLHLAAVFVSNFANYMQVIGEELCQNQQVDFDLLKPLMKEVFEKNQLQNPSQNQTGPALRGDTFTMNKHLEILSGHEKLKELYELISGMIGKKND